MNTLYPPTRYRIHAPILRELSRRPWLTVEQVAEAVSISASWASVHLNDLFRDNELDRYKDYAGSKPAYRYATFGTRYPWMAS